MPTLTTESLVIIGALIIVFFALTYGNRARNHSEQEDWPEEEELLDALD